MNEQTPEELSVFTGFAGDPFVTEVEYHPSSEYIFLKGWSREIPTEFPSVDMKFYPIFGHNSSITYIASPGTFPNGKSNLIYIGEIGTETKISDDPPPNPSRTGYDFGGWSATEFPPIFPNENMEIQSNWIAITSQLTFNYNGGTDSSGRTSSSATRTYDSSWPTAPGINTAPNYTVTFNSNGGSAKASETYYCQFNGYWSSSDGTGTMYYNSSRTPAQQKVSDTANIVAYAGWTKPRAPASGNFGGSTKSGYRFDGWYEGSTKINYYDPLTSNKSLSARWTRSSQSINDLSYEITGYYYTGTGGHTENYTLTVPASATTVLENDSMYLQSIGLWFKIDNNNDKVATVKAKIGQSESQELRSNGISPNPDPVTANITFSGSFTSYKKGNSIAITIPFYVAGGSDHHSANMTAKVTSLYYGL